jgi:hypothetical protein
MVVSRAEGSIQWIASTHPNWKKRLWIIMTSLIVTDSQHQGEAQLVVDVLRSEYWASDSMDIVTEQWINDSDVQEALLPRIVPSEAPLRGRDLNFLCAPRRIQDPVARTRFYRFAERWTWETLSHATIQHRVIMEGKESSAP